MSPMRFRVGPGAWSFIAGASLALAMACGGNGGLGTIGVSLDIPAQTIPGYLPTALQNSCVVNAAGAGSIPVDAVTPISFTFSGSRDLEGRDFIGIAKVFVDEVTLTIIPPSQPGQTWDFLDSIRLYASVPGSPDPPVLVAELAPVPRGRTTIVIPGKHVDIGDIASHDEFQVTGQVSGRPPCADVHFDGDADFDVKLF